MKSIFALPDPGWRPTRPLGRPSWRLLEGLDVAGGCLARRSVADAGYSQLLLLTMIPGFRRRLAQVRRLLWLPVNAAPGTPAPVRWARAGAGSLRNLASLSRTGMRALAAPRR